MKRLYFRSLRILPTREIFGLLAVTLVGASCLLFAGFNALPHPKKVTPISVAPKPEITAVVAPIAATITPKVEAATKEVKDVVETSSIAYTTIDKPDPGLAPGVQNILIKGVRGVKTTTYSVSYENGLEVSRIKKSEVITTPPTNEVIAIGTNDSNPAASPCPTGYTLSAGGDCVLKGGITFTCKDGFVAKTKDICLNHKGLAL